MPNYFSDKNEGTYRNREGRMTPDLSDYWEGAREKCEDNKRGRKHEKKTHTCIRQFFFHHFQTFFCSCKLSGLLACLHVFHLLCPLRLATFFLLFSCHLLTFSLSFSNPRRNSTTRMPPRFTGLTQRYTWLCFFNHFTPSTSLGSIAYHLFDNMVDAHCVRD